MTQSASRTLLAVLAHPDDETFGTGGTLAWYASQGVAVHLLCATRGEVGEMDPEFMEGFSSVAERREYELCCAAKHLGLKAVHFMGYRDSGMPGSPDNSHPQALASQPVEKIAAEVVRAIRKFRPQVVITFDPIGGYRHPDHIAIHNATVLAFSAAGDPAQFPCEFPAYTPQKLYYQTISRRFLRLAVKFMKLIGKDPSRFGRNHDIDLASIAAVEFPTHAVIDYTRVAKLRDEASACHASQGGRTGGISWIRRLFSSKETYMRAHPEPLPGIVERDLFEGI